MNNACECDNLDAYIDGELTAETAENFAAHLKQCADCRQQVEAQHWIDGLLHESSAASLEQPSTEFARSLKSTLAQNRQRAGLVACVFAAAAVLLLATGAVVIRYQFSNQPIDRTNPPIAEVDPSELEAAPILVAAEPIHATVITAASELAVPIDSPSPNVTIVRIYSTYQPEAADTSFASVWMPDDETDWSTNIRGGTL